MGLGRSLLGSGTGLSAEPPWDAFAGLLGSALTRVLPPGLLRSCSLHTPRWAVPGMEVGVRGAASHAVTPPGDPHLPQPRFLLCWNRVLLG